MSTRLFVLLSAFVFSVACGDGDPEPSNEDEELGVIGQGELHILDKTWEFTLDYCLISEESQLHAVLAGHAPPGSSTQKRVEIRRSLVDEHGPFRDTIDFSEGDNLAAADHAYLRTGDENEELLAINPDSRTVTFTGEFTVIADPDLESEEYGDWHRTGSLSASCNSSVAE